MRPGAYRLRKRMVAAAACAWRAFAARNPAAEVHSPRSTDFRSVRSAASSATSFSSPLRRFRCLAVVDRRRFARGISNVSIAQTQWELGSCSIESAR